MKRAVTIILEIHLIKSYIFFPCVLVSLAKKSLNIRSLLSELVGLFIGARKKGVYISM